MLFTDLFLPLCFLYISRGLNYEMTRLIFRIKMQISRKKRMCFEKASNYEYSFT